MKFQISVIAIVAALGLAAGGSAQASGNLVQNPNFAGTGGEGGYGEFYPNPMVASNNNPDYSVQIAGWNAPQDDANSDAPFLFVVNPLTIDTTGFYDSWDYPSDQGQGPGVRTLWGSANGGAGVVSAPPNGASTAMLLDADYHITPIYQIIDPSNLVVGHPYEISFDWAAAQWSQNSGPTTESIQISLGGQSLYTSHVNPSTGVADFQLPSETFSGWMSYTDTFIYQGLPSTVNYGADQGGLTFNAAANWLTFVGEGTPQGLPPTLLLTGVSFTELVGVPEPASWALMLLGFGALGGIVRRRRAIEARLVA